MAPPPCSCAEFAEPTFLESQLLPRGGARGPGDPVGPTLLGTEFTWLRRPLCSVNLSSVEGQCLTARDHGFPAGLLQQVQLGLSQGGEAGQSAVGEQAGDGSGNAGK